MKIGNWLKKVILFPAMCFGIFGNEGGEPSLSERILQFAGDNSQFILKEDVQAEPDAAASEDIAEGADLQGNPGDVADDGLDTAADKADPDADQGEEGDADETDQKDEEGKGTKKKTFEERMAEIEDKLRREHDAKIAELEAKLQQQKPPTPDYVEIDTEKVNGWLQVQNEKINDAELEGNYLLAEQLKREKFSKLDAIDENNKKKAAWEESQKTKQTAEQHNAQFLQNLDNAAVFYRDHMKVEPELWKKMGDWFAAECQRDPVLGRKFAEKASKSAIEAIEFAHKHTVENMGQQVKAATQQKEQTKTKTAAVTAAQTKTAAPLDLKAIHAAYVKAPTEENFARYMEAKRQQKA